MTGCTAGYAKIIIKIEQEVFSDLTFADVRSVEVRTAGAVPCKLVILLIFPQLHQPEVFIPDLNVCISLAPIFRTAL